MMERDKGKAWNDPTLSCDPFGSACQAKIFLERGRTVGGFESGGLRLSPHRHQFGLGLGAGVLL